MKNFIVLGSVLAALASPTVSFAESVQYLGHECVVKPKSTQSIFYDVDALRIVGTSSKVIRCPAWTQTHGGAKISMPNMVSYSPYVKAKNISSARVCVVRKHYNGIPGNSLPSFVCGNGDSDGGTTFTYDLNLPANTFYSRFDQPIVYLYASSSKNPNVRSYGFSYYP